MVAADEQAAEYITQRIMIQESAASALVATAEELRNKSKTNWKYVVL